MKKSLSERDICTKYITPALINAGWDVIKQIREEVSFTKGRIIVRGRMVHRGDAKRADYILYYKPNIPLAIIEAKDNNHSVGDGMQQALEYSTTLDIPFVFSSNGDAFLFHDNTITTGQLEKEIPLESFPSPNELWEKYKTWKGINDEQEKIVAQDYYYEVDWKEPHYYQKTAINKTIEAIAKGQNRILLVMATGTGKTFTVFQIIWRLWKSRTKKRILFLADRNILVDQTITNDFKPFGEKMTKIKNRKVDKSYEIYLALYQSLTGEDDTQNIYKEFSPDFFDLIIIDECHRGSAAEDSIWREILEYFSSATQIGMTATPRETKYISNIDYFGKPIFTYSLKDGISDGFLAPYKVIRITLNVDAEGYRPERGKLDKHGNLIPDRIYNLKDYDRNLVIDERTQIVADKVTEFLTGTNRFDKTIVFCEDIDHATRMRQALINENSDLVLENHKYIMKITGDDNEGKMELDNFIDPESKYPVITTTSKLMTTGIDAQTCKLIVIDKVINSMTEFKQIIGRGTRIREDYDKMFFSIMDFKQATNLFAEPDFDGEPVQIYEPGTDDSVIPPDTQVETPPRDIIDIVTDTKQQIDIEIESIQEKPIRKYYVSGVEVKIINERIQFVDNEGKLITESLKDYSTKKLKEEYKSLDSFLTQWNNAQKKKAIIVELEKQGIFFDEINKEIKKDLDPFDVVCHLAFDQPPLTKKERAENVKKRNYFTKYGEKAKMVLESLLEKYADEGIENIEDMKVLTLKPISDFGTATEIVGYFGGKEKYEEAIINLKQQLYS